MSSDSCSIFVSRSRNFFSSSPAECKISSLWMSRKRSVSRRRARSRQAKPTAAPATVDNPVTSAPVAGVRWPSVDATRAAAAPAPPVSVPVQKREPSDGFFQRTSQTQASAPRAAHCDSLTIARGRRQLVGYRSMVTFCHVHIHIGMKQPGCTSSRNRACARPISTTRIRWLRWIWAAIASTRW